MAQQYPLLPRMYGTQMQDNEELRQLYILLERWGSTLRVGKKEKRILSN